MARALGPLSISELGMLIDAAREGRLVTCTRASDALLAELYKLIAAHDERPPAP